MNDKYRELLEQYDVKVLSTFRSRGTFQCETDQGLALLKEYHSSLRKLAIEYEWKEKLAEAGFLLTDRYFISKEDSLVVYDRYHTPFVLKHYFSGRECDLHSESDVYAACRNLARLHKISAGISDIPFENPRTESIAVLFARRNQELRTIRRYVGRLNKKKSFELLYMKYFHAFYEEAVHALDTLQQMDIQDDSPACGVCHGAYHHHNILILPDGSVATVGFESICYQPYLMDLYLFLRKTMAAVCAFSIFSFYIRKNSGKFPINTTTGGKAGSPQKCWKNWRKSLSRIRNGRIFYSIFPGIC